MWAKDSQIFLSNREYPFNAGALFQKSEHG